MRLVWLTLALLLPVSAVRINHTIDDTDPRVNYLPSAATALACHGCQDSASMSHYGLNASQLFNRTFSAFLWFSVDGSAIELNFTGTALYVFIVLPSIEATNLPANVSFALDGLAQVGGFAMNPTEIPQYNIAAYANTSIANGTHTFRMSMLESAAVALDYAVYTSDDSDPISSPVLPTSTSPHASQLSVSTSKNLPVAAIAGGVVGGIALIACFLFLLLRRRARRSLRNQTADVMPHAPTTISGDAPEVIAEQHPRVLAEEVRILKEEVRQLKERSGSDTVLSDVPHSLRQSLSTMKREQTRALRDHSSGATDTLVVHTDGRLTLRAGQATEELPPTYMDVY